MKAPICGKPQILRRDGRLFFIESSESGHRRMVNLDRVDYIAFGETIYYGEEVSGYAARLYFPDAKCLLFTGDDALALAGYFLHEKYTVEKQLEESSEINSLSVLGEK